MSRKPKFRKGQVVFCLEMSCNRPVKLFCREVSLETKEPFWDDTDHFPHYEGHLRTLTKREIGLPTGNRTEPKQ